MFTDKNKLRNEDGFRGHTLSSRHIIQIQCLHLKVWSLYRVSLPPSPTQCFPKCQKLIQSKSIKKHCISCLQLKPFLIQFLRPYQRHSPFAQHAGRQLCPVWCCRFLLIHHCSMLFSSSSQPNKAIAEF